MAVLALEDALDGDDQKLRLAAALEILDRALGRPHTSASVDLKAVDNSRALLEALIAVNAKEIQPTVIDAVPTAVAGLHSDVPLAIVSNLDGDGTTHRRRGEPLPQKERPSYTGAHATGFKHNLGVSSAHFLHQAAGPRASGIRACHRRQHARLVCEAALRRLCSGNACPKESAATSDRQDHTYLSFQATLISIPSSVIRKSLTDRKMRSARAAQAFGPSCTSPRGHC